MGGQMRKTRLSLCFFSGMIALAASTGLAGQGQPLADVIDKLETLIDEIGTAEALIQENIRQLTEEEAAVQKRIDEETAPQAIMALQRQRMEVQQRKEGFEQKQEEMELLLQKTKEKLSRIREKEKNLPDL